MSLKEHTSQNQECIFELLREETQGFDGNRARSVDRIRAPHAQLLRPFPLRLSSRCFNITATYQEGKNAKHRGSPFICLGEASQKYEKSKQPRRLRPCSRNTPDFSASRRERERLKLLLIFACSMLTTPNEPMNPLSCMEESQEIKTCTQKRSFINLPIATYQCYHRQSPVGTSPRTCIIACSNIPSILRQATE